ncbi:hypothetical protein Hypma_003368 [Hypsizygus marmoreus]|uniref:Zn(2)-C6 fungal-type domain-containing protein n=1 Tax=Hypsizygus marmoreus TaxID=39966 RepID=A0A369J421_HYPMA|nr:hypothetical protein Hypma_003368 [Hypsizygus marmoreus]
MSNATNTQKAYTPVPNDIEATFLAQLARTVKMAPPMRTRQYKEIEETTRNYLHLLHSNCYIPSDTVRDMLKIMANAHNRHFIIPWNTLRPFLRSRHAQELLSSVPGAQPSGHSRVHGMQPIPRPGRKANETHWPPTDDDEEDEEADDEEGEDDEPSTDTSSVGDSSSEDESDGDPLSIVKQEPATDEELLKLKPPPPGPLPFPKKKKKVKQTKESSPQQERLPLPRVLSSPKPRKPASPGHSRPENKRKAPMKDTTATSPAPRTTPPSVRSPSKPAEEPPKGQFPLPCPTALPPPVVISPHPPGPSEASSPTKTSPPAPPAIPSTTAANHSKLPLATPKSVQEAPKEAPITTPAPPSNVESASKAPLPSAGPTGIPSTTPVDRPKLTPSTSKSAEATLTTTRSPNVAGASKVSHPPAGLLAMPNGVPSAAPADHSKEVTASAARSAEAVPAAPATTPTPLSNGASASKAALPSAGPTGIPSTTPLDGPKLTASAPESAEAALTPTPAPSSHAANASQAPLLLAGPIAMPTSGPSATPADRSKVASSVPRSAEPILAALAATPTVTSNVAGVSRSTEGPLSPHSSLGQDGNELLEESDDGTDPCEYCAKRETPCITIGKKLACEPCARLKQKCSLADIRKEQLQRSQSDLVKPSRTTRSASRAAEDQPAVIRKRAASRPAEEPKAKRRRTPAPMRSTLSTRAKSTPPIKATSPARTLVQSMPLVASSSKNPSGAAPPLRLTISHADSLLQQRSDEQGHELEILNSKVQNLQEAHFQLQEDHRRLQAAHLALLRHMGLGDMAVQIANNSTCEGSPEQVTSGPSFLALDSHDTSLPPFNASLGTSLLLFDPTTAQRVGRVKVREPVMDPPPKSTLKRSRKNISTSTRK